MTRDELRAWLDRKPPRLRADADGSPSWSWRCWYDAEGNYLGNRSGAVESEAKGGNET